MSGSKPKHPGGRPPHIPSETTKRMVSSMAAFGINQPDIARVLKIGLTVLQKRYTEELAEGLARANSVVAQSLYEIATSGPVTNARVNAAIFWLKARGGWREVNEVKHEHVTYVARLPDVVPNSQEWERRARKLIDVTPLPAIPKPEATRETGEAA